MRQRANRSSTRAVLTADAPPLRIPPLPRDGARVWQRLTRQWWRGVWQSPMAHEYTESDTLQLYMVARLVDDFWLSPIANTNTMGEIRRQCAQFGLTPLDRRRLEWEIARADEEKPPAPLPIDDDVDPRTYLTAVS